MGCWDCDGSSSRVHDEVCVHKKRTCTDILCLTLFGLFWIGFLLIAAFAFYVGDPLRLVYGTDSFGNVCGRKNSHMDRVSYSGLDLRNQKYVFFMDGNNLKKGLKICVSTCPNETMNSMADIALYYQRTGTNLCRYDYNFSESRSQDDFNKLNYDAGKGLGPCPTFPVYPSRPILNRCIPTNIIGLAKNLGGGLYDYFNSFDTFKQIVGDIIISWREVVVMSAASLLITLMVVFLIHFMANLVAWILLIIVSVSMLLLTAIMWYTYFDLKYKLDWEFSKYTNVVSETWRNEKAFLVIAIVTTVVTVILCLICLVMRKRVKLVVALFHESGACIRSMPGLLLQPFWTFLMLAAFILFWIFVITAMATADYDDKTDQQLAFRARRPSAIMSGSGDLSFGQSDLSILSTVQYNRPSWVRYMWWYAVIAFLWNCEFILGCQQLVIAGAVSSWYFCRDRSNLPCPVGRSIRRLFCYHMGTVALGSFLITLLQIPRIILAYISAKLKDHEDWQIVKGILYCCSCCLWMLESFLQYLNRNAYSVTAYKGTAYCSSARIAFTTIASNAIRVATINSVGDFILFLGKCTVTAITAIAATLLLKVRYPHTTSGDQDDLLINNVALSSSGPFDSSQNMDQLNFYAVPLILISIIAFFIAHCVLSVYEVSTA